jgi:hypothetical protein
LRVAKPGVPPKTNVAHPPWRAPPKELKIDYSDSQAASCGEYPTQTLIISLTRTCVNLKLGL